MIAVRIPATAITPLPPPAATSFMWPTRTPTEVERTFQAPASPWGAGHRGVDLAVDVGAPVYAAGAGTVTFAGEVAHVPVVSITHSGGFRTTYLPVKPAVSVGMELTAGTMIGTLVGGHSEERSVLHWGAKCGHGASVHYFDPLWLLFPPRYRLVPSTAMRADGPG
ncbi:MAG: M23 family metallopeptidase [Bowdeniella nasicola]|nr:M23 family metallopeptidase [Bowdeniella nasicola]